MAAANDDDVEALVHGPYLSCSDPEVKAGRRIVSRESLADAEGGEDGAEHLLDVDPAGQLAEMMGGDSELLGLEFGAELGIGVAPKSGFRGLQFDPVAGASRERPPCPGPGGERGRLGQNLDQAVDPLPGFGGNFDDISAL